MRECSGGGGVGGLKKPSLCRLNISTMKGTEVAQFLQRKWPTRRFFQGVYPVDRLPHSIRYPCCLVINTDTADKSGEHWTALYVSGGGVGVYFDSLGLPPLHPFVVDFLKKHTEKYKCNSSNIQGLLSDKCGYYVLYFLYESASGRTLSQLLQPFSVYWPYQNDLWVVRWYNRHR